MLALLKKNLRHQNSIGSILLILLMTLIAAIDASRDSPYQHPLPYALLFVICFALGLIGAVCAFVTDQYQDHTKFLDYLPVRRTDIWAANYLYGLATVALSVVALFWLRVLDPPTNPANLRVPHPFLSGAALAFAVYSAGTYFRAATSRLTIGVMLAGAAPVALLIITVLLLAVTELHPTLFDLAPLLALAGVIYTFAGWLIFTLTPPAVEPADSTLRGAIIFTAATALFAAGLTAGLFSWKQLDLPGDQNTVSDVAMIEGDGRHLLAKIHGRRSGPHTIRLDLERPGHFDLLGRRLVWPGDRVRWSINRDEPGHVLLGPPIVPSLEGGALIPLLRTRDRYELFETRDRLALISPDRSREEVAYRIPGADSWPSFVFAGATMAAFLVNERGHGSTIVVTDHGGQIRHRIPVEGNGGPRAGSSGKVWMRYTSQPSELVDLHAGTVTKLSEGERVLAVDPRLDRLVLAKRDERGARMIVVRDRATGEERVLLDAEHTARTIERPDYGNESFDYGRPRRFLSPLLVFDQQLDRAVSISEFLVGHSIMTKVELLDLRRGQAKAVIPASTIGERAFKRALSTPPVIHGFAGDTVLVELDARIEAIDLRTGERRLMIAGVYNDQTLCFSPNLTRGARREKETIRVFERDGEERVISLDDNPNEHFWLDDDRLLVKTQNALLVVAADGRSRIQLFPPPR